MKKEVTQLSPKRLEEFYKVSCLLAQAAERSGQVCICKNFVNEAIDFLQKWSDEELQEINHIVRPDLCSFKKHFLRAQEMRPISFDLNDLENIIKRMCKD